MRIEKMAPPKNKIKLTNASIARVESNYTWDTEIAQFGCRYFPKSGKRTFILRYRGINRKQREFRIGTFPAIDVATARTLARQLLGQIALGKDPQHERRMNLHKANTFGQAVDAYLVHAGSNHKKTSLREVTTYCNLYLKPLFGDEYICDMSRGLVQRKYDKLLDTRAITYVNKMIAWGRSIWNWALRRERVEGENPFLIEKKKTKKRRKRILKPDEFAKLWTALEKHRHRGTICNVSLNAIEMFVLTPLRKTEVFRLRWNHVDDTNNMVSVIAHKNDHTAPDIELFITKPLRDLLDRMPRTRTGWLFPSPKSESGHIENIDNAWKTIRDEADILDVTIHDMRRSWNSTGGALGFNPHEMANVIGNSPKVNEEHYWHLLEDKRREISEQVANQIASFKGTGESQS
jgi:integrase